jgi:hypothetical protein
MAAPLTSGVGAGGVAHNRRRPPGEHISMFNIQSDSKQDLQRKEYLIPAPNLVVERAGPDT